MADSAVAERRMVYLVRHGRTDLNAAGRLRGRIDVGLDAVGRREAEELSLLFAAVPLIAVVASPLARSVQTASAVAGRRGLEVSIDPDLTDRDWGEWAGQDENEIIARFGTLDTAPGVEDAEAFRSRVCRALERLAERARRGPVLAVGHDNVNRTALAALVPGLHRSSDIGQRTGCWNRVVWRAGGWAAPIIDARPGDGTEP